MTRASGGQKSPSHKPSQFSTSITPLKPEKWSGLPMCSGVKGTMTGVTETKTIPE